MRLMSLLTVAVVLAALYLVVFDRDRLPRLAGRESVAAAPAAPVEDAQDTAEEVRDAVAVVAMRSQAQPIDSAVVLRGRTEAVRAVEVRAETTGQILSEPLRKGSFVEEGQVLCELEPGTRRAALAEAEARLEEARGRVPEAEAAVEEARARVREAELNVTAARSLSEGGFASETRVAGAEAGLSAAVTGVARAQAGLAAAQAGIAGAEAAVAAARTELDRLTIEAPFGGILETDTAELGALMQPGAPCATVIQLDPIKLVGFVPETDLRRISVGAQAGARLASGDRVQGEVTFLSRSGDDTTRTFRVEVTVPNPELRLRDGETAEILVAAEGREAHLLPQSALTLDDDGALGVRTVTDAGEAAFAPVTLLRDTVEGVWVTGLPDAAAVIVVGQEYVTEGVPVEPTWREAKG